VVVVDAQERDPGREPVSQLQFLEALVDAHASVAGDIVQIGSAAWAIHGSIPVDGDVLVARYESAEDATRALSRLGPNHTDDSGAGA
jgi:hypothetical protein